MRAGCRSAPNCPFKIRINYNEKRGEARVATCETNHSHPIGENVSQGIKRPETARLKFLCGVVPTLITVTVNTTVRQICEAVFKRYGQAISQRQGQKLKRLLVKKPCRHCEQRGHSGKHCPNRSGSAENEGTHGEDGATDEDTSGNELPRRKSRCHICFQTGHNRQKCPDKGPPLQPGPPISEDAFATYGDQLQQTACASDPLPHGEGDFNDAQPHNEDGETDQIPQPQPDAVISQPPSTSPSTSTAPTSYHQVHCTGMVPPMTYSIPHQMPRAMAITQSRPQENLRLRAAELMRQAASLTQEAAKLNFEAARLLALTPI